MAKKDTFKCEHCGITFEKGWSDEKRDAEAEENGFGDLTEDERCIVCSKCYDDIMGATIQ